MIFFLHQIYNHLQSMRFCFLFPYDLKMLFWGFFKVKLSLISPHFGENGKNWSSVIHHFAFLFFVSLRYAFSSTISFFLLCGHLSLRVSMDDSHPLQIYLLSVDLSPFVFILVGVGYVFYFAFQVASCWEINWGNRSKT